MENIFNNVASTGTSEFRRLEPRQAQTLPHRPVRITVCAGMAWVTVHGEDYFIEPGETLQIAKGEYPGVISPAKKHRLVYQIGFVETTPLQIKRVIPIAS